SRPGLVGLETADFSGKLHAIAGHVAALSRNNIDDAEKGVVPIKTGAGTADDLDTVDEVHVQNEFGADISAVGEAVAQSVPIYQLQDAVVVDCHVDAADAEECIVPVVGDVHSRYGLQDVRQRPVPIFLHFVGCNNGSRRRRFGDLLGVLGGGFDD